VGTRLASKLSNAAAGWTLSPEMGVYLNMQSNQRADLSQNIHPDGRKPRAKSISFQYRLIMMNADGTPKSLSQATHTEHRFLHSAHVFTGWSFTNSQCQMATIISLAVAQIYRCQFPAPDVNALRCHI
jgi:hypothetical protein